MVQAWNELSEQGKSTENVCSGSLTCGREGKEGVGGKLLSVAKMLKIVV